METVEIHLLRNDAHGNPTDTCKRILVAGPDFELMIELYHLMVGVFVWDIDTICKRVQLGPTQIEFIERVEHTISERYTGYVVNAFDAASLLQSLNRHHWGVADGNPAICKNFREGQPLANRTIYSS